jgi:hypothetical protein
MQVALDVIRKVDNERLQRGVEGLIACANKITLASQSDAEIRGFVANGDGQEYGVVLSEGQCFCGCKDAIYRHGICKHAVALALFVIRNPIETKKEEPKSVNLKLAKVRPSTLA